MAMLSFIKQGFWKHRTLDKCKVVWSYLDISVWCDWHLAFICPNVQCFLFSFLHNKKKARTPNARWPSSEQSTAERKMDIPLDIRKTLGRDMLQTHNSGLHFRLALQSCLLFISARIPTTLPPALNFEKQGLFLGFKISRNQGCLTLLKLR